MDALKIENGAQKFLNGIILPAKIVDNTEENSKQIT